MHWPRILYSRSQIYPYRYELYDWGKIALQCKNYQYTVTFSFIVFQAYDFWLLGSTEDNRYYETPTPHSIH